MRSRRIALGASSVAVAALSMVAFLPLAVTWASASVVRRPHPLSMKRSSDPFAVVSSTPASGAAGVSPNGQVIVRFSEVLSPKSILPSLAPSTVGSWQVRGTTFVFTPRADFIPLSDITLTIPGGPSGIVSSKGARLFHTVVDHFQIANGSILRLQELLSMLDYSPLAIKSRPHALSVKNVLGQRSALYRAPVRVFSWRSSGWPVSLQVLWKQGLYNIFTEGEVMSFQADHGLIPNGALTSSLWSALLNAYQHHQVNTGGYNYAVADKRSPETLTVWHNGKVVVSSLANTGISVSPTADGNFAVYERLRSQVMRGTNPNGSSYADFVQYVAYFNGNDAVHYMPRAQYGYPQSLGCVELPFQSAAVAWPYLAYGTLVSVVN